MDIGLNIKLLRTSRKLSRKAMSEKIGLSAGYIEEIESNKKSPSIDTLLKLGAFFNVTISELIGEVNEPFTPELKVLIDNAKDLTPEQLEQLSKFLKTLK